MTRRSLLGSLLLLPLLGLYLLPRSEARTAATTQGSAPAATQAPLPRAAAPARAAARVVQHQFRVVYEQEVSVDGKTHSAVKMAGLWSVTPTERGSSVASLRLDRLDWKGGEAPSHEQLGLPISLSSVEGRLLGIGFPQEMPAAARGALTELSAAFQCSQGDGAAWTREEEDRLGRYRATYQRAPDGKISRRREYTAIRGAGGLGVEGLRALSVDDQSTFEHDGEGLLRARVQLTHSIQAPKAPPIRAALVATLERVQLVEVAPAEASPAEALSDHVDHGSLDRKRDEALVGGASREQLIADATQAARGGRERPDAQKARSVALRRLAALARVDPGASAAIADEIRRAPEDSSAASMLAGSLSSARSPAATNALAGLLADALPEATLHSVLTGLALTEAPTTESLAVLSGNLDRPLGGRSALALGAQIHAMAGAPGAADALDALIERFRAARTPLERATYLEALANAGGERVLPILAEVIQGGDLELARVAVFGLRRVPGDEADALLERLLWGEPPLALDAVQAIAHRNPERWRPKMEKAAEVYAGIKQLEDAIQTLLARWAPMPAHADEDSGE